MSTGQYFEIKDPRLILFLGCCAVSVVKYHYTDCVHLDTTWSRKGPNQVWECSSCWRSCPQEGGYHGRD